MPDKRELARILGSAAGHLSRRRWCASKGAKKLRVRDIFEFFSGPDATFFGATFSFVGNDKVYCAPFVLSQKKSTPMLEPARIGGLYLGEAETNPYFISKCIDGMRGGRGGGAVKWSGSGIPKGKVKDVWLLGKDSSNVVVGFRVGTIETVYKGYRTFDAFNPEPELLSYISAKSAESVPRFLGACTLTGRGTKEKRPVVLGLLVERVEGTDAFRKAVEDAKRCIVGGDIASLELAAGAGRAVGEMHSLLSAATKPDLRPERISRGDVERWQSRIADEYHSALKLLDGDQMKQLAWAAKELAPLVTGMKGWKDGKKQRTHQDLHLGQMLFDERKRKLTIIDFEGEPMRRGKERTERLPPERDVATMLRSFSYAAAVALIEHAKEGKGGIAPKLAQARARMWERASCATFLLWYISPATVPASDVQDFLERVDVWCVEKALYEIIYEAKYRPAWVHIPLGGLLEVLERPGF